MIQKLIEALRSGEYEQTTKKLRRGNSFCCMGVACDIYQKETGKGEWHRDYFHADGFDSSAYSMPMKVARFFGFSGSNPEVRGLTLSGWNDYKGKSFEEIADLLEKEYGTVSGN